MVSLLMADYRVPEAKVRGSKGSVPIGKVEIFPAPPLTPRTRPLSMTIPMPRATNNASVCGQPLLRDISFRPQAAYIPFDWAQRSKETIDKYTVV